MGKFTGKFTGRNVMLGSRVLQTEVGPCYLLASDAYLYGIYWREQDATGDCGLNILDEAERQVREYLQGRRRVFDIPVKPEGTEFQLRVWDALCGIPYGETCSYQEVAGILGQPKACRAVGAANSRNPLSLVIPCHRVIGADGGLGGYAGGLAVKQFLLERERYYGGV